MAKRNAKAIAEKLIQQNRPGITKPEILCISPEKTGTTWLYMNLRRHSQVWVTPVKEVHFLAHGHGIPRHTVANVLCNPHWYYDGLRRGLKEKISRCFSSRHTDTLFDEKMQWMWNYTFGKRSYEWYTNLFPITPKLCADISPSYYELPAERIREHQAHNPATKIIIIVRNPIDRVWSRARMILCQRQERRVDQVDHVEFLGLFDYAYQNWRPYAQTIALWQSYFDEVHVAFYDELAVNPVTFFAKVCAFLDISEDAPASNLTKRVNQGIQAELPLHLRRYLFEQYGGEMNEMAENGISYAHKWLKEHNEIVKQESSK